MILFNCNSSVSSDCTEMELGNNVSVASIQVPEYHEFGEKLANAFTNALDKVKKKLGFVDCRNGGKKTTEGICECPPYYEGETCEELICVNNGTRIELANKSYACKCAYPEHISGKHCELVRCDNNGQPQKDGHCRCLDYWYTGQFCESYTASWGAVVGVPLVCITIIVICCIVCRLDFCPRRKIRQSRRRHPDEINEAFTRPSRWARNLEDQMQQNRILQQRSYDSAIRLQENLWNEDLNLSRCIRTEQNVVTACPIRLDTIPVFNPRMIGGVSERDLKLIEPPPPYEQAVSSNFSQQQQSVNRNNASPRPPGYTPTASHQSGTALER